jgi:hypothetical protein
LSTNNTLSALYHEEFKGENSSTNFLPILA